MPERAPRVLACHSGLVYPATNLLRRYLTPTEIWTDVGGVCHNGNGVAGFPVTSYLEGCRGIVIGRICCLSEENETWMKG